MSRKVEKLEWAVPVDDSGFNLPDAEPGALFAGLADGSRVVVRETEDGYELLGRLNGPPTSSEVARCGLTGAKTVRVRQQPFEYEGSTEDNPIPVELRGRLGKVLRFGGSFKYSDTATVKLHRAVPHEQRTARDLPLVWIEAVAEPVADKE